MKDKSEYTAFVAAFKIIPNAPEFLYAIQSEWHTVYLFGNLGMSSLKQDKQYKYLLTLVEI